MRCSLVNLRFDLVSFDENMVNVTCSHAMVTKNCAMITLNLLMHLYDIYCLHFISNTLPFSYLHILNLFGKGNYRALKPF